MLRAAMALLLLVSCWQPAVAGAVAQVIVSRGGASSVLPVLPVGAPVSGLSDVSLSGLHASLTGAMSSTLAPAPAVSETPQAPAGRISLRPAPSVIVAPAAAAAADAAAGPVSAPIPLGLPAPISVSASADVPQTGDAAAAPSALTSVSQVSAELSRTAAPRGGSTSGSAAVQSPALDRLYDGGIRAGLAADPVDATMAPRPAVLPALEKSRVLAAAKAQLPAVETERKASRQALIGTALYKFGMESLGITMPLIALTVFGSAVWMATMAAGWGISMTVASMFAGGLIDRRPVQKVLAGALVTQAAAVGGIIALLALGLANPWLVLPLYSLAGLTQGVVLTARGILPTRLLASDESVLGKFNAKTHMIYETAGTIAPLLVGLLISKAGLLAGLFVLPPAFLLAALAFTRLKLGPAQDADRGEDGLGLKDRIKRTASEVREGARIMLGSKEFRWLGVMMAGPAILHRAIEQILTPFFANSVLHASAQAALIVSGSNLGELVGAAMLLSTLMNREKGQKPTPLRWIRPMALAGLCAWAFLTGALWLVVPAVLAMGLTFAANDVGISSYFQSRLPSGSSGKAMGFMMAAELGSVMAVSYALGFLLDMLPVGIALVVVGAAFSAMIPLFYKGYGRLRDAQKSKA